MRVMFRHAFLIRSTVVALSLIAAGAVVVAQAQDSPAAKASVTVNGKTYRRFTQFKDTAADEFFCE